MAVCQIATTYYVMAAVLHFLLPRLHDFQTVQKGQRREAQVLQEARDSIGELPFAALAYTCQGT
mgnify:FL=1